MKMYALGLIETVGYTTAVSAADAALKAANVTLIAVEKVIGAGGSLGVTIHLNGDVGAVQSAVEAGKIEAERVGKLISAHVIPRAHSEVDQKLLSKFGLFEKESTKTVVNESKAKKTETKATKTEIKKTETKKKQFNNSLSVDQSDQSIEQQNPENQDN